MALFELLLDHVMVPSANRLPHVRAPELRHVALVGFDVSVTAVNLTCPIASASAHAKFEERLRRFAFERMVEFEKLAWWSFFRTLQDIFRPWQPLGEGLPMSNPYIPEFQILVLGILK